MNQHLKLKEIIWEITNQCNNNCSYCGSNDIKKCQPPSDTQIKHICDEICKYPPEQIDISGGDPLLVSEEMHEYITNKFKENKVISKILVNPKSINPKSITDTKKRIFNLYDWIGISINTKEEIEDFYFFIEEIEDLKLSRQFDIFKKSTIITNFNLTNIWFFNDIYEVAKSNNLVWQIQFTMGDNNIYTNPEAVTFLVSKLKEINYNKLVIADNMNSGNCSAGLNSCGITYEGYVVPCLSMRSWKKNISVLGSLFDEVTENPLKYIWQESFKEYRFCEFKCCKDICGNIQIDKLLLENNCYKIVDIIGGSGTYTPPPNPNINSITVYGVFPNPNITLVYGVSR